MSQGLFSDTLIRLEAFKTIFVSRPKLDFFLRGQVHAFWPNMTNFSSRHFSLVNVLRNLRVSQKFLRDHF